MRPQNRNADADHFRPSTVFMSAVAPRKSCFLYSTEAVSPANELKSSCMYALDRLQSLVIAPESQPSGLLR